MTIPRKDTMWSLSSAGNHWRRLDGKLLVVGYNESHGRYWARADQRFAEGSLETLSEAKAAAERIA